MTSTYKIIKQDKMGDHKKVSLNFCPQFDEVLSLEVASINPQQSFTAVLNFFENLPSEKKDFSSGLIVFMNSSEEINTAKANVGDYSLESMFAGSLPSHLIDLKCGFIGGVLCQSEFFSSSLYITKDFNECERFIRTAHAREGFRTFGSTSNTWFPHIIPPFTYGRLGLPGICGWYNSANSEGSLSLGSLVQIRTAYISEHNNDPRYSNVKIIIDNMSQTENSDPRTIYVGLIIDF